MKMTFKMKRFPSTAKNIGCREPSEAVIYCIPCGKIAVVVVFMHFWFYNQLSPRPSARISAILRCKTIAPRNNDIEGARPVL